MISIKTYLLVFHLIGLCLALGPVILLDVRLSRLLTGRPVTRLDIELVETLQPYVRAGLSFLWLSGIGFLLFYEVNTPGALANPKLHAKLAIVLILTLNGWLVEHFVLGQLQAREGRSLFCARDRRQRLALLAVGAVSATSWYMPLLLGAVRELNFACAAWIIISGYLGLIALAFAGSAAILGLATRRLNRAPAGGLAYRGGVGAMLTDALPMKAEG